MNSNVSFQRASCGVPQIDADEEASVWFGQGMAHATDRGLQMLLMRIVGQGRVSEILDSSDESLRVDRFFRRANWSADTQAALEKLDPEELCWLEAYCEGANRVFARRVPWELKLCRYRPKPWRPEDCVLLLRMMGYLKLAASQGEMERLLIELVQACVSKEKLEELFPGLLGGLDVELIKQVKLSERLVPADLWGLAVPRLMASNNWVISGRKTASGKPILANDVHLEGNRLPAVWCEMVLRCKERYLTGGTIPGIPGVLAGRNNHLAWGVTYAFVDAEDSWIERCQDGKFYRDDESAWINFHVRTEIINRKGKTPVKVEFFENNHGVLEGDPRLEGYYLASRWAPADSGAGALKASFGLLHADSVEQGMGLLSKVETAWNFVLADRPGDIGYQMSGLVPKRREGISGLVPLPGWEHENDWQGFARPEELPHVKNPPEGFFVTANDNLNRYGLTPAINLPMGPYRADRIRDLLSVGDKFGLADMFEMHFDTYSRQAAAFMELLRPLLSSLPQRDTLKDWDLRYTADSESAWLFERFYEELYREVFGQGGLGERVVDALRSETGTFIDFYHNFDRVLLAESSAWFGGRSRSQVYRQVAARSWQAPPMKWGKHQQFRMKNIFFNGKLPLFLGFDRGPFTALGGRATIHQAQLYSSHGRETSFLPSFRFVTDLATDCIHTTLAGGPSDRRFSRYYASDVVNWLNGRYKTLSPAPSSRLLSRGIAQETTVD